MASKETTVNITRTGGVTRTRRIFTLVPPVIDNGGTLSQDKGKQVVSNKKMQDSTPINNVEEFVCINKRSEYKVLDQLNQTPSKK